ncbi:MAG: tyrosine-type recombinase/integrase [Candidatus Omnitrophota bacterium]
MKPFESFLTSKLEDYIDYRKSLGYTDKGLRYLLMPLDRYVREKKADWDSLKPSFFLDLRGKIKKEPRTVNEILCGIRGFFQFLVRTGHLEENPLQDIPPLAQRAYIPFIFSSDETEELFSAIQGRVRKTEDHFLKDLTLHLAVVLLAGCGLRIREPTRLLRTHYRAREGTLYIEKTKFKKDRLIPAPKKVRVQIDNYLAVRGSLLHEDQNPYLLWAPEKRKLSINGIYSVFHQAVKDIGLNEPRKVMDNITFGSPTPHSLRHSFAVNTLKRLKEQGKSPQYALPILCAYMGHRKYRYTALYLKVLDAEHRKGLVDFALHHKR